MAAQEDTDAAYGTYAPPLTIDLTVKLSRLCQRLGVLGRLTRWIGRRLRRTYPHCVDYKALDFRLRLHHYDSVSARALLLRPNTYDRREFRFMRQQLAKGDVFVDVGAHIGIYALVAARAVGAEGRVLAIEADPDLCRRMAFNIRENALANIRTLNLGVSDKPERLRLGLGRNRGSSSFLAESDSYLEVECQDLATILRDQGVDRVKMMKIDVEGFEERVLGAFFLQAEEKLFPEYLIVEDHPQKSSPALRALLERAGYTTIFPAHQNLVMRRS